MHAPLIMGILNTTPDSFYAASRVQTDNILAKAEKMIADGASILDIGGMSTRPDAAFVSADEELRRTIPAIESLKKAFPNTDISIDTYRSSVAQAAIQAGATMINDVSGGRHDAELSELVAQSGLPYVLMHSVGTPDTMHQNPHYDDVFETIFTYFKTKIAALNAIGVQNIVLDPGFGFGKTIAENYTLLRRLADFKTLNCPILVGISRKSMIYKPLNSRPEDVLPATTALHLFALQQGANILRTHDIAEAQQSITLFKLL